MDNIIISYYPGSGGNRLYNKLLGLEYETVNKIYDYEYLRHTPHLIKISLRKFLKTVEYIYNDSKFADDYANRIILTHCMDIDLIKSVVPNRKIIQIVSNYKQSLRRQWVLATQNSKKTYFENDLDNAFTFIKWHNRYYKEYPKNGTPDEIVDITDNADINNKFALIMQTEFSNTNSFYFDYAWKIFEKYGENAPVIDLYGNLTNEQK